MKKITAESLCDRGNKLFENRERVNAREEWDDLANYIMPNQSGIFYQEEDKGVKKTQKIYDSVQVQANQDLSGAIHSIVTNPARKWVQLRHADDRLNDIDEVTQYLETVANRIHQRLNESNFTTQVSKNYQFYSGLGSMVLMQEEVWSDGEFQGYRFNAWHLAEVAWSENKHGIVDTLYRKFKLTARQAVEMWPDTVDDSIKKAAEHSPSDEFEFMQAIFPRDPKDVEINSIGLAAPNKRPFALYYIDTHHKKIMDEGGFYELPFYATRFNTLPGEHYGRGPGHIALPDIKTLNRVKQLGLSAMEKAISPPLLANRRGVLGPLDLRAGKVTVVNGTDSVKEFTTQARFDVTQFSVEDLRNSIRGMFFIDKLLLPPRTETGEMTAFEVAQRTEQMQRVLGPQLARLDSEFLRPLIVRCFKMLLRNGELPPLPDALRQAGVEVDIVFVNQLALAQQMTDVTNIQAWLQDIGLLAQVKPEVVDMIDADGIAKHTAKVRGIPEIAVADEDQVQQVREQRAQQQQAEQALQAGTAVADIEAKLGGNNGGV